MKIVNCKIWRDFDDDDWRIAVFFWRWEIARFKVFGLTGRVERI